MPEIVIVLYCTLAVKCTDMSPEIPIVVFGRRRGRGGMIYFRADKTHLMVTFVQPINLVDGDEMKILFAFLD